MVRRPATSEHFSWPLWLLVAEALFLCCVASWLQGDLWFDEVLSWQVVFNHDTPWSIFRDYRFANNHFLSNFLEWLWLRGLNLNGGNELLVRVPPLLCGMGTVALALLGWRRFLGERVAFLVAVLLATSPVFTAFAWQFRGYSLSMFLSALVVTVARLRWNKSSVGNALFLFMGSIFMPLVMPPAAMLPAAVSFALFAGKLCAEWHREKWQSRWLCAFRCAWPAALGGVLGTTYYLTLLEEFLRASRESGGWENAWIVGLHLLLAFALHLGVICLPVVQTVVKHLLVVKSRKRLDAEEDFARWLLGGCVLAVVAVLLLPSPVHRAPFPRVFLPLLPGVTLAAALMARNWHWLAEASAGKFRYLLAGIICFALLVRWGSDTLMQCQWNSVAAPPQNLLQQYYRGDSGISSLLREYKELPPEQLSRQLVLISPYDLPTATFYWRLYGLPGFGEADLFLNRPANLTTSADLEPYRRAGFRFLLLAQNEQEAREWVSYAGFPETVELEEVDKEARHRLYFVQAKN